MFYPYAVSRGRLVMSVELVNRRWPTQIAPAYPLKNLFVPVSVTASAQEMNLEPGNPVARDHSDESHIYEVNLTAGQFARFQHYQRAIDVALILHASDGKQLVEMNLTRAREDESLSLEAASGDVWRMGASHRSLTSVYKCLCNTNVHGFLLVTKTWRRSSNLRQPDLP